MKLHMLDTDISSYIIKQRSRAIQHKMDQLKMAQVCISVVTKAELLVGIEKSASKKVNRHIVDVFFSHLTVLDWNGAAAEFYAIIRAQLERVGTPIGANDTMIAAHAKSIDAVLVTNNTKHFKYVKGLTVDNWAK